MRKVVQFKTFFTIRILQTHFRVLFFVWKLSSERQKPHHSPGKRYTKLRPCQKPSPSSFFWKNNLFISTQTISFLKFSCLEHTINWKKIKLRTKSAKNPKPSLLLRPVKENWNQKVYPSCFFVLFLSKHVLGLQMWLCGSTFAVLTEDQGSIPSAPSMAYG